MCLFKRLVGFEPRPIRYKDSHEFFLFFFKLGPSTAMEVKGRSVKYLLTRAGQHCSQVMTLKVVFLRVTFAGLLFSFLRAVGAGYIVSRLLDSRCLHIAD